MSHFTVLVVTDSPEDLEKTLQPFHEYECTGIKDEYVEWLDETEEKTKDYNEDIIPMVVENGKPLYTKYSDEAKKFWVRDGDGIASFSSKDKFVLSDDLELGDIPATKAYPSLKDYLIGWHGYTEENFKGDTVGRYTNPNAKWDWYEVGGRWPNILDGKDQVQLKDLNFEKMKMQRKANRYANWEEFEKRPEKEQEDKFTREYIHGIKEGITKEEYLKTDEGFYTFAVIKDGQWYERGSMGWWGCVSDEKEEDIWSNEFNKLLNNLPKEKYITVVDCHI